MNEIVKMVVVLGLICAVSGLTLAGVHAVTKKPIEMQVLKNVQGPAIEDVFQGLTGPDYDPIAHNFKVPAGKDKKGRDAEKAVFPAMKGGQLNAVALAGVGKGFDGDISVMVGVTPGGEITGISVMEHTETPGIGSKITQPSFTKQFDGLSVQNPTAVDGISGATYSTRGVFEAVNNAVDFYRKNKQDILSKAEAAQ